MTPDRRHARGRVPVIPGSFDYHRPKSVQEAVSLLAKLGDDSRLLAGGHSLVPMMKLRLPTPANLDRSRRYRRTQGHPGRRQRHRHRRDDDTARVDRLRSSWPTRFRSCARLRHKSPIRRCAMSARLAAMSPTAIPANDMPAVMLCLECDLSMSPAKAANAARGAWILPGRLFHRDAKRRGLDRRSHSGAGRRARLRVRETQAQDRRLRDRRRCRGAHDERPARSRAARSGSPMSPKRRYGRRKRRRSWPAQRSTRRL